MKLARRKLMRLTNFAFNFGMKLQQIIFTTNRFENVSN